MRKYTKKKAVCFVAAAVGLVVGLGIWHADWQPVMADQLSTAIPAYSGLITHVHEIDGRPTRVIVIDPQMRAMGVYDIGPESGEIQLKSIRRLSADLQMLEFNSSEPSPADIQSRLEQR